MFTTQFDNNSYHFLYGLDSRQANENYFKFKNKHGYRFTECELNDFIEQTLLLLNNNSTWNDAKNLIVPQTTNLNFMTLLSKSHKNIITLKKNSKEKIIECVMKQNMMKSEREKLMKMLKNMDIIKMANFAGNQRKRLVECIFEEVKLEHLQTPCLFFDDSLFSGYTFLAALFQIKHIEHDNIILFNKQVLM